MSGLLLAEAARRAAVTQRDGEGEKEVWKGHAISAASLHFLAQHPR